MNIYYKLSLLYIVIGVFFLVVGFYTTNLNQDLSTFYKRPYTVEKNDEEEVENA